MKKNKKFWKQRAVFWSGKFWEAAEQAGDWEDTATELSSQCQIYHREAILWKARAEEVGRLYLKLLDLSPGYVRRNEEDNKPKEEA